MPKSPVQRKAEQRARQAEAGIGKLELQLDQQELEMLDHDCASRRPGREPYDRAELVALMIRKYHAELLATQEELSKRQCGKCGDQLPVTECCMSGDSKCWATKGWHELKLVI